MTNALRAPLTDKEVAVYLARLGVTHPRCPSMAGLACLHRAHVSRVPYEILHIQLDAPKGRSVGLDPHRAVDRISAGGRGGYCFHLNGAFELLLRALGYHVTPCTGTVLDERRASGQQPWRWGNHLLLTVSGLPTSAHREGTWLVDVGLGDALHGPVPLAEGTHDDAPWRFEIKAPADGQFGQWTLLHQPGATFHSMIWRQREPGDDAEFKHHDTWLSTSPESAFTTTFTAKRRHAGGADVLTGCALKRYGPAGFLQPERVLHVTERHAWISMLRDVFGLHVGEPDSPDVMRLWRQVSARHQKWSADQFAARRLTES